MSSCVTLPVLSENGCCCAQTQHCWQSRHATTHRRLTPPFLLLRVGVCIIQIMFPVREVVDDEVKAVQLTRFQAEATLTHLPLCGALLGPVMRVVVMRYVMVLHEHIRKMCVCVFG